MTEDRNWKALAPSSLKWLGGITATAIVTSLLSFLGPGVWRWLQETVGTTWAAALIAVAAASVSVLAAAYSGALKGRMRSAGIWCTYVLRMLPYWIRELTVSRGTASGKRNRRFESETTFEADNLKRRGLADASRLGEPPIDQVADHYDFGVWWRDDARNGIAGIRLTWIEATGELVAVQHEGPVEIITIVPTEHAVESLLDGWSYQCAFGHRLSWVRRRARGWNVPIHPRAQWWQAEDSLPAKPWPPPAFPSVGRDVGAYMGDKEADRVDVVEPGQPTRSLYHYVDASPTGFSWGYGGAGPSDLARSLLADRLGYVPAPQICWRFREDIVAILRDEFILQFHEVDSWIEAHSSMFADDPRAQPFDPVAAGGAY